MVIISLGKNKKRLEKKQLVQELWRIRREEKFSDWSDVKKRLKLD